jgi:hypothetical protein
MDNVRINDDVRINDVRINILQEESLDMDDV